MSEIAKMVKSQKDCVTILCWNSECDKDCDTNVSIFIAVLKSFFKPSNTLSYPFPIKIALTQYFFQKSIEHLLRPHAHQFAPPVPRPGEHPAPRRVSCLRGDHLTAGDAVPKRTPALRGLSHPLGAMSCLPGLLHSPPSAVGGADFPDHCQRLRDVPLGEQAAAEALCRDNTASRGPTGQDNRTRHLAKAQASAANEQVPNQVA